MYSALVKKCVEKKMQLGVGDIASVPHTSETVK